MLGDDLNRLDWYILGYLANFAQNVDQHPYHRAAPEADLALSQFGGTREAIAESLKKLADYELIYLRFDDAMEDTVIEDHYPEITPKGSYCILQNWLTYVENVHGLTWDYPGDVSEALQKIVKSVDDSDSPSVPGADRMVSRTDNEDAWENATRALDEVIAEFNKDHPRDNELGTTKPALLDALRAGRRLLDDTRMDVQIGTALLVEPLKLLITRYENQLVGALASTAFLAIAKLLGLL